MKLVFKILNYELYHIEDNLFLVATKYKRPNSNHFSRKALWIDNEGFCKLTFIDKDFNENIIPNYFFKRVHNFIHNYLAPFRVYDTVIYKDKLYTIVDTKGLAKINGEWKEVISYIEKFGKVKYHREKEDFINKFKLIERG